MPKSHVLTLRWVMRDPTPDDATDGPLPAGHGHPDGVHAAAATDKPIRVIDGGRVVGVVDRARILDRDRRGAGGAESATAPSA